MSKGRIAFLIATVVVIILIIKSVVNTNKLTQHGTDIVAIVQKYSHVRYYNNELSTRLVEFHKVDYSYNFKGLNFTSSSELQPAEYQQLFSSELEKGDTITIVVSITTPSISMIKKQL